MGEGRNWPVARSRLWRAARIAVVNLARREYDNRNIGLEGPGMQGDLTQVPMETELAANGRF